MDSKLEEPKLQNIKNQLKKQKSDSEDSFNSSFGASSFESCDLSEENHDTMPQEKNNKFTFEP
jgi:hypothetical protein